MILPNAFIMDTTPQNFIHETWSVQGPIGSGKSTLLNMLRNRQDKLEKKFGYPFFFVDEPVNEWSVPIYDNNTKSALDVFYSNMVEHGFTFQILAFTTRMEYLIKETSQLKTKSICITERSMLSDSDVFFKNLKKHINPLQANTYDRLFKLNCTNFNRTEKRMIYFESTPEECLERIKERDAKGDSKIDLSLLQDHDILHKEMIANFEKEGGIVYRYKPPHVKDHVHLEKYLDDFLDTIN